MRGSLRSQSAVYKMPKPIIDENKFNSWSHWTLLSLVMSVVTKYFSEELPREQNFSYKNDRRSWGKRILLILWLYGLQIWCSGYWRYKFSTLSGDSYYCFHNGNLATGTSSRHPNSNNQSTLVQRAMANFIFDQLKWSSHILLLIWMGADCFTSSRAE